MSKCRFGVIGAGMISHSSCQDINGHANAIVVAASDKSEERLDELCKKFSIGFKSPNAADIFKRPDIDAIYIAVPNAFHAPLAIQALEAGKHVILDKPFALSYGEAEKVVATAKKHGKTLMLGMNQRFNKDSQIIRTLRRAGELGEVYHAKAYWFRRSGIPKLGTWFGNKKLAGGGALLDIGVHLLDLALFLMDNFEPTSVSGATYTKFGNRGIGEGGWGSSDRSETVFDVDDFATALIKLKGGASLSLDVSWAIIAKQDSMNVNLYGTEKGASAYPAELFSMGEHPGEFRHIEHPHAEIDYPHCNRFHHFINVLLGTEKPCVTVEQSLAVQKILDGIYASCRSGREVSFV